MATQKDVKEWFYTCFRPCFTNKCNTFVEGHKCKIYNGWCGDKYDSKNVLPINCDHAYQPDVILEDRHNGKISYIIEIEGGGGPGLKGIPGAILLADYCVAKQQSEKFRILFISCSEGNIKKIQARIVAANSYCHWKNLDKAEICSFEDFKSDPIGKLIGLFC